MNIYYEFETDVPREQLEPLLDWVLNQATCDGDYGSWNLAKNNRPRSRGNVAPTWMLSLEIWDTDNFSECVYIQREQFDAALASDWLVLLLDETMAGGSRVTLFENEDDYEDMIELCEVIGHLMAHNSMGYSWGDGPSAFMFDKKEGYHVPMGALCDDFNPEEHLRQKALHKNQLTMFDLFNG